MPTYPIIHKETKEQKEITLSVAEWEKFKEENPLWIRDWSDPQTVPNTGEVGELNDKLRVRHPSWGEVLKKVKKSGGMNAKMDTL